MKKVVFISSIFPKPVDNGKKVVISGFINYLLEKYGEKNIAYILLDSLDNIRDLHLPFNLIQLGKIGVFQRLWNLFWYAIVLRKKSIQECMLFSPFNQKKLLNIIKQINPDLIILDTFRVGQYFEDKDNIKAKKVLYMEDLFSIRYKRMLEVHQKFSDVELNPLGNFAKFVPRFLRPFVKLTFLQKMLLAFEKNLVMKREKEIVNSFDCNLLINRDEALFLSSETGLNNIKSVKPLLYKTNKYATRQYKGDPIFVFLGSLKIPHNLFAIKNFIESQMDKVIEKVPNVKLRIIGKGANEDLLQLVEVYNNYISIEGYVENLEEVFRESCAMLVPLQFGSGVKLKSLDALSYGLPVISTSIGMEGIPVENGINCFIEDDLAKFPDLMKILWDKKANEEISKHAREFYLKNYSRDKVFNEYDQFFSFKI
ncbi:glycosyltransferase family 4 protein [Aeribacillus alveayuensis]|uniref:Glycosyltransferase involved in cell wall biosynthesis n=1 Tax=Aeribacillus alveayuensis TaxID=279215 RepID=A0ABT9VNK4_9BACI|nr:glycosyltransferase involved in cell wall biosynthesis [Bacillus alveayuensis]